MIGDQTLEELWSSPLNDKIPKHENDTSGQAKDSLSPRKRRRGRKKASIKFQGTHKVTHEIIVTKEESKNFSRFQTNGCVSPKENSVHLDNSEWTQARKGSLDVKKTFSGMNYAPNIAFKNQLEELKLRDDDFLSPSKSTTIPITSPTESIIKLSNANPPLLNLTKMQKPHKISEEEAREKKCDRLTKQMRQLKMTIR